MSPSAAPLAATLPEHPGSLVAMTTVVATHQACVNSQHLVGAQVKLMAGTSLPFSFLPMPEVGRELGPTPNRYLTSPRPPVLTLTSHYKFYPQQALPAILQGLVPPVSVL